MQSTSTVEKAGSRLSLQARPRRTEAVRGEITVVTAVATAGLILLGYALTSPLILWLSLAPALWLAATQPIRLVQLLAVTSPIFPVVRVTRDFIGAQQVSTKGLFLSGDDPIIVALGVAWLLATLRTGARTRGAYPTAVLWLLVIYPLVAMANLGRLDSDQSMVSALYYLKWAEYAALLVFIPQTIRGADALRLVGSLTRLMLASLLVSACFAVYEVAEAVRTGSYSQAASIPRASAFFGSLDPARFGASEDPVNFGAYVVVAGSVALAVLGANKRSGWLPGTSFLASLVALVLSASRAPWLAGVLAFARVQKLGSSRVMIGGLALVFAITSSLAFAPQIWQASFSRVEALTDWNFATEQSAHSRIEIALNSPVFELDPYWLVGHGHSSYRFIAQEHLSRITSGLSRSLYNFFLTVWYDAGPIGVILWIVMFAQLRKRLTTIHRHCPAPAVRTFAWGMLGALWGLALASMFGEVPYNWRVMSVFYAGVGTCLAANEAARSAAVPRVFSWGIRQ